MTYSFDSLRISQVFMATFVEYFSIGQCVYNKYNIHLNMWTVVPTFLFVDVQSIYRALVINLSRFPWNSIMKFSAALV